jgi:hypothetical protein
MTEEMESVTYCGLYCGLCGGRARIPRRAEALHEAMDDEGWPQWGNGVPGFSEFWSFLDSLLSDGGCPGCRAEGGWPGCPIRVCARERGLELCNLCPDFPCSHVEGLAARYPTLIADNRRMQVVGMECWLSEQEERARRGVVYADTRYPADGSS